MSYEGYEQHICKNGHQFDTVCHDGDGMAKCPICSAVSIWFNSVDETNGPPQGRIVDWSSLQLTSEEVQVCNLGHKHVIKHATYRIPTKEERLKLRTYYSE